MKSLRRLALLCLALAAGLGAAVLPGRAQAPSGRFAFADTTLLRDTLNLHFDHLFETADSLGILPDSLRAQVIRYRLPIHRLVAMSDSMHVPVDSVGVYIDRERLNPLSENFVQGGETSFRYNSDYNILKINTSWSNGVDVLVKRGGMLAHNLTTVDIERNNSTAGLTVIQRRNSSTDASWRIARGMSVGGVATLTGYDDPAQSERTGNYQLSSLVQSAVKGGASSKLNLLAGYLTVDNLTQVKRGLSGDANGSSRWVIGDWFSHDFNAGLKGNLARSRRPTSAVTLSTRDFTGSLRGGLQLYQAAPVGLNVNYSGIRTTVQNPSTVTRDSVLIDTVTSILTSQYASDATVRMRRTNNQYVNFQGKLSGSTNSLGTGSEANWNAQGRWAQGLWTLDATYNDTRRVTKRPVAGVNGGYDQHDLDRRAHAELSRPLTRRLVGRLTGDIGLQQFRSVVTAEGAAPPTPRDSYTQSYRIEGLYNPADVFNTTVALEVGLQRAINLPSSSAANNTDTRSYRGEWRWNYRLMRGLTANQVNTVVATYQIFPFSPNRSNMGLDYNALTTLNAVLIPPSQLTLDVTHSARQQPSGEWRVLPDGSGVLLPATESKDYTLRANVTWYLSRAFSFNVAPEYLANARTGTTNGVETPTRTGRTLRITGGASLDVDLGRTGKLTGHIGRTFTDAQSILYKNGEPQPSPLSQTDDWVGSLSLVWSL